VLLTLACMSASFSILVCVAYARIRQREASSTTTVRIGRKGKKSMAAALRVLQKVESDVVRRYTHQPQ
jgi:hypothetical protein